MPDSTSVCGHHIWRETGTFTVVTTDALAFQRVSGEVHDARDLRAKGRSSGNPSDVSRDGAGRFYVYSRNNADFMKVRRLTHVWLHHGDSDKEACFRRKSAAYDVLAVAGQARSTATPRMGSTFRREVRILGRPQIENIETATASISTVDRPVALYAPTWYAADYKNNHPLFLLA